MSPLDCSEILSRLPERDLAAELKVSAVERARGPVLETSRTTQTGNPNQGNTNQENATRKTQTRQLTPEREHGSSQNDTWGFELQPRAKRKWLLAGQEFPRTGDARAK